MSSPPTRGTSSKSPRAPAPVVQGKHLIIAFLGAIVLAAGIIFWIGMSGGSRHVPQSKPGVDFQGPSR